MLQSWAKTTVQTDRDPNNTDEVSLYPCKCPKSPPTLTNTYTAKPQQHTSGTHQIITPQQQPKGSRNTCNPQKPRNPSEKHHCYNPSWETASENRGWHCHPQWTPMGSSYKKENCFQAIKQQNSGAKKQVMPSWILSDSSFGTPSHIIIHTGTNDLRREQERVGQLICRVAEKATETYPNTKITISTLLPRRDIHPDTIQGVNADISKGCARLPNVYLAHHPSLSIRDLYDHVHIRKDKVNVFAKTLKHIAWSRQTTSSPLKTTHLPTHLPTHRTQIQTPSRNAQSHHREWPPLDAQNWRPTHHAKFPIRTPHAPALHHHKTPQSEPDDHLWHPRPPQKHHSRQRSNTRMGPSPAANNAPSADNTPISAPLPDSRSYAQALKGQANTLEMSEIRQLLNYISAQLTAWGSTQHTNICLTMRKTKQQHYF